jgi:hypothetical protein
MFQRLFSIIHVLFQLMQSIFLFKFVFIHDYVFKKIVQVFYFVEKFITFIFLLMCDFLQTNPCFMIIVMFQ